MWEEVWFQWLDSRFSFRTHYVYDDACAATLCLLSTFFQEPASYFLWSKDLVIESEIRSKYNFTPPPAGSLTQISASHEDPFSHRSHWLSLGYQCHVRDWRWSLESLTWNHSLLLPLPLFLWIFFLLILIRFRDGNWFLSHYRFFSSFFLTALSSQRMRDQWFSSWEILTDRRTICEKQNPEIQKTERQEDEIRMKGRRS